MSSNQYKLTKRKITGYFNNRTCEVIFSVTSKYVKNINKLMPTSVYRECFQEDGMGDYPVITCTFSEDLKDIKDITITISEFKSEYFQTYNGMSVLDEDEIALVKEEAFKILEESLLTR